MTARWTLGIDPGKLGAAVLLNTDADICQYWDTPTIQTAGKAVYDTAAMCRIIRKAKTYRADIAIERVHAMPGQGVTSMFTFGEGYGLWLGMIGMAEVPVTFYTPQAWQKTQLAGMPKGKGSSRLRAKQLWPTATLFDRARDNGRADAALIARHHQRTTGGTSGQSI